MQLVDLAGFGRGGLVKMIHISQNVSILFLNYHLLKAPPKKKLIPYKGTIGIIIIVDFWGPLSKW